MKLVASLCGVCISFLPSSVHPLIADLGDALPPAGEGALR